jgi:hypothetical protein
MRTTETRITFAHPFSLAALGGTQPAGTYRVMIDEEEIDGLSFVAFRRVGTLFCLPALSLSAEPRQVVPVEPAEIDEALGRDRAAGLPAGG